MGVCRGITSQGVRCKLKVGQNEFCAYHLSQALTIPTPNSKKCIGLHPDGASCTHFIPNTYKYCYLHRFQKSSIEPLSDEMPKVSGDHLGSKPDQGPILPGGASDNRPLITEKIKFNFISNRRCHAILDNGDACPGHPKGHYIYCYAHRSLHYRSNVSTHCNCRIIKGSKCKNSLGKNFKNSGYCKMHQSQNPLINFNKLQKKK